jgi:hypothetical protein
MTIERNKKHLRRKALAVRYDTDLRTIDRWWRNGTLPKPDFFLCRSPIWTTDSIEKYERRAVRMRSVQP